MTHNKIIKIFDDMTCHLELEDERLKVARVSHQAYLVKNYKYTRSFKKREDFHAKRFKKNRNFMSN